MRTLSILFLYKKKKNNKQLQVDTNSTKMRHGKQLTSEQLERSQAARSSNIMSNRRGDAGGAGIDRKGIRDRSPVCCGGWAVQTRGWRGSGASQYAASGVTCFKLRITSSGLAARWWEKLQAAQMCRPELRAYPSFLPSFFPTYQSSYPPIYLFVFLLYLSFGIRWLYNVLIFVDNGRKILSTNARPFGFHFRAYFVRFFFRCRRCIKDTISQ